MEKSRTRCTLALLVIAFVFMISMPAFAYADTGGESNADFQALLSTQATTSGHYTDAIEESEPNDSFATADLLSLNRYVYGTSSSDDRDFYAVTVQTAGLYTLSFVGDSPSSGGSWGIKVYDYDRGEVLYRGYYASDISRSDWDVELPAGTAYIEVNGIDGGYVGITLGSAYHVRLSKKNARISDTTSVAGFVKATGSEIESNDNIETANSIALGSFVSGTSSSDDRDFFVVKVPYSGLYKLSFAGNSPNSGGSWGIKVYDYDRGEVLYKGYYASDISRSDWDVELPAGTAYIEVNGIDGGYVGITLGSAYDVRLSALVTNATVSSVKNVTYTGKKIIQKPVVKYGSVALKAGTDYSLSYKNNVNAGTATVTITGKGAYTGSVSKTFTIAKAANTLKASAKTKTLTVKYAKLKKANQTIAKKSAFVVSGNKGSVTFKKVSGNKKITVSKAGKITVKKGLKKKTYTVKVKVTAKGNKNYKPATKVVTVKVAVK